MLNLISFKRAGFYQFILCKLMHTPFFNLFFPLSDIVCLRFEECVKYLSIEKSSPILLGPEQDRISVLFQY